MGASLDSEPNDESFGIDNVVLKERGNPIANEVFCAASDTNYANGLPKMSIFDFNAFFHYFLIPNSFIVDSYLSTFFLFKYVNNFFLVDTKLTKPRLAL